MLGRIDELLELRAGVGEGDAGACDELREVGQALRGSGGTFGFPELSAAAGLVETTPDAHALRRLEGLVVELRRLAEEGRGERAKRFEWLARCAGIADEGVADVTGDATDVEEAWSVVSRRQGLDDSELARRVAQRFGLEVTSLADRSRAARRLVPEALMSSSRIVPVAEDSTTITVGTGDPTSLSTELEIQRLTGRSAVFAVAPPAAIRVVLDSLVDDAAPAPDTVRTTHAAPEVVAVAGPGSLPGTGEPAPSGERAPPPSVLVVDDEASSRLLIRALLEKRGFEAVEASDGLEALDVIRDDDSIGLAVVDLNMPRMDGLELIWVLRDAHAWADLPVIVVTGERDEILETQIMEEGADDYIRKPLDPRLFVARVEATLRRAGQRV